ncbi:hypothetical protein A2U01_0016729 [Trifolium medium]|uniref:Uncharacterized protein n=1 Tax=Trifolium medium TaxID=97028 RepID=A0A392N7H3_9FABA|nr:hypothetical protein [Trifolium medium]
MVIDRARSQWDPGGAARSPAGKGRVGAAQVSFSVATAGFSVDRSGAGRGLSIPGQDWDFIFMGFKGYF